MGNNQIVQTNMHLLKMEASILKVLVYFDLFHYPLSYEELISFVDIVVDEEEFITIIEELLLSKKIFKLTEYYSLRNDAFLSERRNKGTLAAAPLLEKGEKIANLLYKFPYVRAVGISGSVSKNCADENADVDYFIITKANRLWIARTLLHLFKKISFTRNRNKYYCMNYFIDEADLLIEEKNIYTATEIFTLMPIAGNGSMTKFFEANTWSYTYFPNRNLPAIKKAVRKHQPWYKIFSEFLFNNKLGDWLDNYFLKLTTRRWKKKEEEKRLNTKGERMGLKTSKHCSKPNPVFFHDSFINKYTKSLDEKRREWGL